MKIKFIRNVAWKVNLVGRLSYYKIAHHFLVLLKTAPSFVEMKISRELVWRSSRWCVIKGSSQNVTVFSNEDSFIWLRPPTHPLHMKVWKSEYRCIINQTPPRQVRSISTLQIVQHVLTLMTMERLNDRMMLWLPPEAKGETMERVVQKCHTNSSNS